MRFSKAKIVNVNWVCIRRVFLRGDNIVRLWLLDRDTRCLLMAGAHWTARQCRHNVNSYVASGNKVQITMTDDGEINPKASTETCTFYFGCALRKIYLHIFCFGWALKSSNNASLSGWSATQCKTSTDSKPLLFLQLPGCTYTVDLVWAVPETLAEVIHIALHK